MRSTQVLAVLAVLATSVSSISISHASNQLVHRRHDRRHATHDSVMQARGARRAVPIDDVPDMSRRDNTARPRRKRGLNQRRCAPKTTTGLLETTSAAPTSSVVPTSTSSAAPTTTPEPDPTTSQAKPTTSSKSKNVKTSETPTKTSTSAKPTATNDGDSGSSSETYTGQATYYGTGLGSCGITSKDTDYIVAVSQLLYDGFEGFTGGNPNNNPICGKKIKATYQGKSVTVKVVDRCVGCALRDLDFSPSAFTQLADQSLGRLSGMDWVFV